MRSLLGDFLNCCLLYLRSLVIDSRIFLICDSVGLIPISFNSLIRYLVKSLIADFRLNLFILIFEIIFIYICTICFYFLSVFKSEIFKNNYVLGYLKM